MVLLGFLINDCTNTCSNCGAVRLKRHFDRQLKESSRGIHSEIWRVIRLTILKRELEQETLMEYMRPYLERTSDFQACTAAFRKLKKEVEKNGSKLVVFIYPMLYELNETFPFTPIHEQMLTFFDEEDISAFDITRSYLKNMKRCFEQAILAAPVDATSPSLPTPHVGSGRPPR